MQRTMLMRITNGFDSCKKQALTTERRTYRQCKSYKKLRCLKKWFLKSEKVRLIRPKAGKA